jgi:hypothetical protein
VVVADDAHGAVPTLWVIVKVPTPVNAGLKSPVEETPGPDQEPPDVTAVN